MNSSTYRGFWWLPEFPCDVVPGQLLIDERGHCQLQLIGTFNLRAAAKLENIDQPQARAIQEERFRVVFGRTDKQAITLLNCFSGLRTRSQLDIEVQEALVGAHVNHEETAFQSAYLEIENLTSWLTCDPIEVAWDEAADSATISHPVAQSCTVTREGVDWTITARGQSQPFQAKHTRESIVVSSQLVYYLELTPAEPCTVGAFHKIAQDLMNLITLAAGRASGQIKLTLIHRSPMKLRSTDGSTTTIDRRVEYHGARIHAADGDAAAPAGWEFLFHCSDAPFESVVTNWLVLQEKIREACNVYFGLKYARPTFVEARLQLIATVAESLGRELQSRGTRKINAQRSYRLCLEDLANRVDTTVRQVLIPDVNDWVERMKTARNELAHSGNNQSKQDVFDLELITTTLISLVLMAEIGLPTEVQLRAVNGPLRLPWAQ